MNIYTGKEATDNVNVSKAVEIGNQQLIHFQSRCPEGFRAKLLPEVAAMAQGKKIWKVPLSKVLTQI